MALCSSCSQKLPDDGLYIQCVGCNKSLHFECASISLATFKSMGDQRRANWRCATCKGKDGGAKAADLKYLDKKFAELKSGLEKSQEFLSERYEDLFKEMSETKSVVSALNKTIETLLVQIKEKDDTIEQLVTRVNHLEQYERKCNFEISELQVVDGERLEDTVVKVAEKLGVAIKEEEIDAVHRLPGRKGKIAPVIVQLMSRKKRDLIVNKRNSVNILNADLIANGNNQKIFINENLTPYFKNLLWQTKSVARDKSYKYVWFKNCKVLVRKGDTDPVMRIFNAGDLAKLI